MSQRQYWDLAERVNQKTGIPTEFIWGQWAHETGGFTSALTDENNLAGLTQTTANDMAQPDGSLHYMRFNSKEEFADYYANYIGLYKEDGIFEAKTRTEFASALKRGGYFGDSEENYVAGMDHWLGGQGGFYDGAPVNMGRLPTGNYPSTTPTKEPTASSYWEEAQDKILNSLFNASTVGAGRIAWKNIEANGINSAGVGELELTQADVDLVTKAFPNNPTVQRWVLLTASSRENLALLIQAKQEDLERAERVANYKGVKWADGTIFEGLSASTPFTVLGDLLDPVNLIPFAGTGAKGLTLGTRTMARLGGYAPALNKVVNLGSKGGQAFLTQGVLNTADRHLAEKASGYEQDYTSAFIIGGTFGTLAPVAVHGLKKLAGYGNKGAQKVLGALDNMETHATAQAMDAPLPNARKVSFETAKSFHDVSFVEKYTAGSKYLSKMAEENKVVAITRKQADELGALLKTKIPKEAKAFYNKAEDYTVLITDKIKEGTSIDNLLAHEEGVHGGMQKLFGTKVYNDIKAYVEKQIASPTKEWMPAVRRASSGGGGFEEVLGYYIEQTGLQTPLTKRLASNAAKGLRKLGYKGAITEPEVKDVIKRVLNNEVDKVNGYTTNPDGSVVIQDLAFSADNVMNPHILSEHYDLEPHLETQKDLKLLPKRLGKILESGKLFGTTFGVLTNSVAPTLRKLGHSLFPDARLRAYLGELDMPVEDIKKDMLQKLNSHMNHFMEVRTNALFGDITKKVKGSLHHTALIEEYNQQVVECYNATYSSNRAGLRSLEFPPHIKEGAASLKTLRDAIVDLGKKSNRHYNGKGKDLIDPDWMPWDDELWRIMDEDKFTSFLEKFNHIDDVKRFLKEYAFKAVKKDVLHSKLLSHKDKEALAVWEKAKANLKEGQAEPTKPKQITEVSREEFTQYLEKEIHDWVEGTVDRNNSNLLLFEDKTSSELPFFKERLPMDTSLVMQTPHGEHFSFDSTLRATDLDRIIPQAINRFSGEAAFKTLFATPADYAHRVAKVKSELSHATSMGHLTEKDMQRELRTLEEGVNALRGLRTKVDARGKMDAFASLWQRLAYSQNGSNMGFNQVGEVGGPIGQLGARSALHLFPGLKELLHQVKQGKYDPTLVKETHNKVFGEMMGHRIWSDASRFESRVFKEVSTRGSKLRHLDKVGTFFNYTSQAVSQLNVIGPLTRKMVQGAEEDALVDSVEWAFGKEMKTWKRNPFSETKLKAAGITKELSNTIQVDIRKYTTIDSAGNYKDIDVERWVQESPTSYWKWKFMLENQGRRAIVQDSIGNRNLLKDANWGTKLLFQFKDFTAKAVNSQTLRALTSWEREDGLAALYSMATNLGIYIGLTHARAWTYYADDEFKRNAYIDDRTSWKNLGAAAVLRGVITGSALSFGQDIYEATTGAQSFRTTVDRTSQFGSQQNQPRDVGNVIGDFVNQLPAVRAMTSSTITPAKKAYDWLVDDEKITQRDLKALYRALPLQNFIPAVWLSNQMIEDSGLPRK